MNRVHLSGRLSGRAALRYTPAGVPVLEATLRHEGEVVEAGAPRQVAVEVDTVTVGAPALRLDRISLNAELHVSGFIAPRSRRSRRLRVHITEFESGE